eukprot:c8227_g1_i1.p1 GENE.c8227_g1_i1~~c8227_g1_i1.p1  ORF type:complete len:271 (-),score=65.39 c8227_g1_i1:46-858(-)
MNTSKPEQVLFSVGMDKRDILTISATEISSTTKLPRPFPHSSATSSSPAPSPPVRSTPTLSVVMKTKDALALLGLESSSSPSELKAAYLKEAFKYHPKRNNSGAKKFSEVSAAYKRLSSDYNAKEESIIQLNMDDMLDMFDTTVNEYPSAAIDPCPCPCCGGYHSDKESEDGESKVYVRTTKTRERLQAKVGEKKHVRSSKSDVTVEDQRRLEQEAYLIAQKLIEEEESEKCKQNKKKEKKKKKKQKPKQGDDDENLPNLQRNLRKEKDL